MLELLKHVTTAIAGFLVGHYLAIGRDRRNEFNVATKAFREAFIPMQQRLRKESIIDIMQEEFPSQDVAMQKFTPYLAGKKMADFEKLWQKYQEKHDIAISIDGGSDIFYNDSNELRSVTTEITTLIEDILLFAKPR